MIGDNIKKFREKQNLSQSDLAESLFVTRQAVSSWERGITEPSIDMIEQIADKLDISEYSLLYYDERYDVDRLLIHSLRSANILILALHNYLSVKNDVSFFPIFVSPFTIFLVTIIMSIVFANSFKTNDFSIIAGYNSKKDTITKMKKQLYYILLLSIILSIFSSICYLGVYISPPKMVMPIAIIILLTFVIGLCLITFVVSRKVK